MEGVAVLDTENPGVVDNKTKVEKMAKRISIGGVPRKKLGDISNLSPRPKLTNQIQMEQSIPVTTVQYIEQLRKENMTLMKLLADRTKIIELSRMELYKLQSNFQKVQIQNLHLAQANSQILGELNSGKDKLKTLRHELGCKNSLLNVRNLELKEKEKMVPCLPTEIEVQKIKCDEAGVSSQADEVDNNKPCNIKRRRQSKTKSWAPSLTKPVQARGKTEKERVCVRRQSARFKREEPEPSSEDLFEIDEAKFSASPLRDDTSTLGLSVKKEDEENDAPTTFGDHEFRRSSIGRPLRRAAEKVQSYKEVPLNVKMRRSE